MPVNDYWGTETADLDVDEAVEVDLEGNPVIQGIDRDIPKAIIDAKGDLIVGGDADSPQRLAAGTDGQALVVDGTVSGGLAWATPASAEHNHVEADLPATLATDTEVATAVTNHEGLADPHPTYATDTDLTTHAAAADPHPVYATDTDLTTHAGTPHGTAHPDLASHDTLGLATQAELDAHAAAGDPHAGYIQESLFDAKGDLVVATAADTPGRLAAGTDGRVLLADSAQAAGLRWGDVASASSILGHATWTGTQAITTVTDLPLSVPVTVPAGRLLRITGRLYVSNTTANARSALYIFEGPTQLAGGFVIHPNASNTTVDVDFLINPTGGSHTYQLRGAASTGTSTFASDSAHPGFLAVEDITGSVWPAGQAITPGMIASEPWTPYTPSNTNVTIGNGTEVARYTKIGRTVHVQYSLFWGSTTAFTGHVHIGLPMAAAPHHASNIGGVASVWLHDSSTAVGHAASAWLVSTTQIRFQASGATSLASVSATGPFTWASGDVLNFSYTYEAAS